MTITAILARFGWRNLLTGAVAVVAVVAVEAFLHDPFGWRAAKVVRLQAEAAKASDEARARSLEADGERAGAQRVTVLLKTTQAARSATSQLAQAAQAAPDAAAPLDAARVARIRADDEALCRLDRLAGCAGETR
jgi:hypothetical protein